MWPRRTTDTPAQSRAAREKLPGIARWRPNLALRRIDGHILRTTSDAWAWYRLPAQRWSFRGDADRENLITAIASQYSELSGRWLHLRVTSRPHGVAEWARAHSDHYTHRLPDVAGTLTWPEYLVGEQHQLLGSRLLDKHVYLGVQLRPRTLTERAAEQLSRLPGTLNLDARELAALRDDAGHLDRQLARPGLLAQPATPIEIRWLLQRSTTLGLPPPNDDPAAPHDGMWRTEDLSAVSELAAWTQQPWAPTLQVHGRGLPHTGQSRHVAVLSLGLTQPLDIPERDLPWMALADQVPAPVEWSARLYVRPGEDVSSELSRQAGRVRSQLGHYANDHGLEPPPSLERQAEQVTEIEDDLSTGLTNLATRVKSWWRVAVSGDTEAEALDHAQALADLYAPKVTFEHPPGQYGLAREFIPGESLASTVHTRRGSVVWAASAVPQTTARIGDRHGILLGETLTAGRSPVTWDPWRAQEVRNASGLTAITAKLGGGKSFVGCGIVYKTLRAGAHWTVLDPSGPLSRLATLPEIAPYARVIDLLRAQPGILNPYRVVPTPVADDYRPDEHERLREDIIFADAARRRLVREVLTRILPGRLASDPETGSVILEAVRRVGSTPHAHPGMVIDEIKTLNDDNMAEHAKRVWRFLDEAREQLRLLIPDHPEQDPYASTRDDRLTVLGMAGLTLPRDSMPREEWSEAEVLGAELLNLAAWLTQRAIYEGPTGRGDQWRNVRKGVLIDEAFILSEVATGRMLMNRFARDSRKWNVRVLLSTQLPGDLLRLHSTSTDPSGGGTGGIGALLDSALIGELDDETAQTDALNLLGVPTGIGYEPSLSGLRVHGDQPRQFLFADGEHGVEPITVDFSGPHLQHLRDALNTTPDGQRRDLSPAATDTTSPSTPATAIPPGTVDTAHAADGAGEQP